MELLTAAWLPVSSALAAASTDGGAGDAVRSFFSRVACLGDAATRHEAPRDGGVRGDGVLGEGVLVVRGDVPRFCRGVLDLEGVADAVRAEFAADGDADEGCDELTGVDPP